MEKRGRKVYYVPVVDAGNTVCGVIRMHDVVAT
jgi:Mg/Co/Ni transporter MgtE